MTGQLLRRARWWTREGVPERVHHYWVRKNPWLHARQLDIERTYWKARCYAAEGKGPQP